MKNIAILGSTGSIGTQTLDIVRANGDLRITALTAHKNTELLERQVREFRPGLVCMYDSQAAEDLKIRIRDLPVKVVDGMDGLVEAAAGTDADDVKLDIGGVDVTKGFRVTVNGTEARAVLLAPYEVPKEAGAPDGMWIENGDGTVTRNVTVVPGRYCAADAAESLDALACPGASAPATGATTLTAPKPVGDKGFFKVWVSDAPIAAEP